MGEDLPEDAPTQDAEESESRQLVEEPAQDPEEVARRERRAQLLQDLPMSIQQNFEERRKREIKASQDPYEIEFQRKRKLFDKLVEEMHAPTPLQEAQLRSRMEENYARVKQVRKAMRTKPKTSRGRRRPGTSSGGRGVYAVEDVELPEALFSPGEIEAVIQDTVGYHVFWSQPSRYAGTEGLSEVRASIQRAEQDGISEVVTSKARIEYKWADLDEDWRQAFVQPLCKAVGVYLDHRGISGVPKEKFVDPTRILSFRFVLTNKGGQTLDVAELIRPGGFFGGIRTRTPASTQPLRLRLACWDTIWSTSLRCRTSGPFTMRMCRQPSCKEKICREKKRST